MPATEDKIAEAPKEEAKAEATKEEKPKENPGQKK